MVHSGSIPNNSFANEVFLSFIWQYINVAKKSSPQNAEETLDKILDNNTTVNNDTDLQNKLKGLSFRDYYNNKLEPKIKNRLDILNDKKMKY